MTTEELLKLKTDYAAWFVPGDEIDLSEVADDVTKLVDELLVTRGNLAAVTAQLAERSLVAEQLSMALNVRDTQLATIADPRRHHRRRPARHCPPCHLHRIPAFQGAAPMSPPRSAPGWTPA